MYNIRCRCGISVIPVNLLTYLLTYLLTQCGFWYRDTVPVSGDRPEQSNSAWRGSRAGKMRTTSNVLCDGAGRATQRHRSQHNRYVRPLLQLILRMLSYAHRVFSGLAVPYIGPL